MQIVAKCWECNRPLTKNEIIETKYVEDFPRHFCCNCSELMDGIYNCEHDWSLDTGTYHVCSKCGLHST